MKETSHTVLVFAGVGERNFTALVFAGVGGVLGFLG